MENLQRIERHKEPSAPEQFYYDIKGIIARARRERVPVEQLKLRETGDEREVILTVIKKVGDIIEM